MAGALRGGCCDGAGARGGAALARQQADLDLQALTPRPVWLWALAALKCRRTLGEPAALKCRRTLGELAALKCRRTLGEPAALKCRRTLGELAALKCRRTGRWG